MTQTASKCKESARKKRVGSDSSVNEKGILSEDMPEEPNGK